MRRAYVGLSSPLAYDYSNRFEVDIPLVSAPGVMYNSIPYPNPILESPFGLLLLYDEIWFLSRALCPKNMLGLPYVKFVVEGEHFESILDKYVDYNAPEVREFVERSYFELSMFSVPQLQSRLNDLPLLWSPQLSDRSEVFVVGSTPCIGLAARLETVLMDMVYMSHLDIADLELVANRFTTPIIARLTAESRHARSAVSNRAALIEKILIDRIPGYLSSDGPYHPCVEEARDDRFLVDFRKWASSKPHLQTEQEILNTAREVGEAFQRTQRDVFLKYLSPAESYYSVGKGLAYTVVDLLCAGLGTVGSMLETALKGRRAEQVRWQGFIASQEQRLRQGR